MKANQLKSHNITSTVDQVMISVPKGYKRTEAGVFPQDWQVVFIHEVSDVLVGKDLVEEQFSNISDDKHCYPVYSNTVDYPGIYGYYSFAEYQKDAVTVVGRGVGLGTAYHRDSGFGAIGRLIVLFPKCNTHYLAYFINEKVSIHNESGGVPQLTGIGLGGYKIALPSIEEQTAIANALSDVDALIQELEKLIAKKQAIKTATMQQLLTGRTRLPQFAHHPDGRKKGYKPSELGEIPEDWEFYNLPEKVWFQEGPGLRKWQFTNKGLKVINVTNLQENGFLDLERTDRHVSWEEFEKTYKHFACDEGDLVIASSGNSYCKVSIVRACDLPLLMNTSVIRFKPLDNFSKQYMDVFLKSKYFKDQIDLMITGGAQPNFGPAHLNLVKILAPTCNREQYAVAAILCDMDKEIQALDQHLSKTRQIKQGMMQELLTGKTRLVKPARSPADAY